MWIKLTFIFLFIGLLLSSCDTNKDVPKPNIVIINVDDLGWKDLGYTGSRYYETPNIDQLSRSGMVFTNGYATAANCAPSRASLMTGKWTTRHGIYTVASSERGESRHRKLIPAENITTLPKKFPTIASVLAEAGYTTCHSGKWHLSKSPLDYGFDINIAGGHNGHPRSYYPPYGNVKISGDTSQYLTDAIMANVLQFIDTVKGPFFLYYAPYAVHTPIHPVTKLLLKYQNKPEWQGQGNAEYATMVENLDDNIGQLIALLKSRELLKNTLVVFTSDNGGLYGITKQKPLRAGKGSYYEGGIRVPYIFRWDGKIKAGSKNSFPISNLDLFPTFLEISGIEVAPYNPDGINLIPVLTGESDHIERSIYWHFPVYLQAYNVHDNENRDSLFRTRPGSVIRKGKWKLHYYFEDDSIELYNLEVDIAEANNMAFENQGKAQELLFLLKEWWKTTNAPIPAELNPEFELDD
jgi:arylsulfatase A-like enzyme